MIKFSKHFSEKELACKCGKCDFIGMHEDFMSKLEAIRQDSRWAKPIRLSSAYRCPDHNSKVSSTGKDGPHTTSRAVDCLISGGDVQIFTLLAIQHGMTGIGWKQKGDYKSRFIHIDDITEGIRPHSWSY